MFTRPPRPRSRASRVAADDTGRRGERIAGWWLRLKGWRILARRGSIVAVVEVKTRGTAADLDHAIDERRLARVAAAAEILAPTYAPDCDVRIDVILLAPGTPPRHIENAWIGY